ncbi:MAG: hypothetical protein LBK63_06985 [Treponema sp.]|jgi:hypothetical protein|nr:hypothetical protein [Treponema sp.]
MKTTELAKLIKSLHMAGYEISKIDGNKYCIELKIHPIDPAEVEPEEEPGEATEAAPATPAPPDYKEWSRSMITEFYSMEDEIKNPKWPLTPDVIPNHMGINLCSVEGMSWTRQADRQLVSLTIHFFPA